MEHEAIVVLTRKSARQILSDGGSGSWVLNPRNARRARYLICVRNGENHEPDSGEEHGSAFLIGTISGLGALPPQNGQPRWRVLISQYALLSVDGVWKGWRNPVRYTTLKELGIHLQTVEFQDVPATAQDAALESSIPSTSQARPLTLREAKEGLALTFGVSPEAVEITIRG